MKFKAGDAVVPKYEHEWYFANHDISGPLTILRTEKSHTRGYTDLLYFHEINLGCFDSRVELVAHKIPIKDYL